MAWDPDGRSPKETACRVKARAAVPLNGPSTALAADVRVHDAEFRAEAGATTVHEEAGRTSSKGSALWNRIRRKVMGDTGQTCGKRL